MLVTALCLYVALSFKKVKKGVKIFVPPSLSLIVENLTLRVFGIMISENLGSISGYVCESLCEYSS